MKSSFIITFLGKLLFPLLCIVFTYSFYSSIKSLDPIASSYPKGIIVILSILIVWTLIVELKKMFVSKDENTISQVSIINLVKEWKKPLSTLLILLLFVILLPKLGFYVSTFFFLLVLFIALGLRDIKVILFNLVLLLLLSFTVFDYFLQIQLPKGIFF